MDIRNVPYSQIDLKKWDKCIDSSLNGTVFGYSWYLNLVCENWEAIILNDYEAIMPLPLCTFLRRPAVISPCLAPQLGVFSPRLPAPEIIDSFLSCLRSKYRFVKVGLNKYNLISDEAFKIKTGLSFNLDLIPSYTKLFHSFSRETKQIIETGRSKKYSVVKGLRLNDFIQFYRTRCVHKSKHDDKIFYNKLRRLISFTILHRIGELYGAYSPENNLSATVFIIKTRQRITFLASAMMPDNSGLLAFALLLDHLLKQFAEKDLTIDFEILPCPPKYVPRFGLYPKKREPGKSLSGLYKGFGATLFNYPIIVYNNLPVLLKTAGKVFNFGSGNTCNIYV
ncbi:MAG: hypothetical protein JSV24_06140 [Bacteroidales bacterium]|nr:MAG: hypothetical protein JSV24_06140 [Bacteroidales bacterium]